MFSHKPLKCHHSIFNVNQRVQGNNYCRSQKDILIRIDRCSLQWTNQAKLVFENVSVLIHHINQLTVKKVRYLANRVSNIGCNQSRSYSLLISLFMQFPNNIEFTGPSLIKGVVCPSFEGVCK